MTLCATLLSFSAAKLRSNIECNHIENSFITMKTVLNIVELLDTTISKLVGNMTENWAWLHKKLCVTNCCKYGRKISVFVQTTT